MILAAFWFECKPSGFGAVLLDAQVVRYRLVLRDGFSLESVKALDLSCFSS